MSSNNVEYVELYKLGEDGIREKTTDLLVRGTTAGDGLYVIGINNWIINDKGEFLVQKRALNKINNPGKWSSTNGLRGIGESSLVACLREIEEELGVRLSEDAIIPVEESRVAGEHLLVDIFVTISDVNLDDIILQEIEVSEARYVSLEELLEMDISSTCQYIKEIGKKLQDIASSHRNKQKIK